MRTSAGSVGPKASPTDPYFILAYVRAALNGYIRSAWFSGCAIRARSTANSVVTAFHSHLYTVRTCHGVYH